jgi:hypothetical protein
MLRLETEMADSSKQMSLRECGASDKAKNLKAKLTGWGMVCKARTNHPQSRRLRVIRNLHGQAGVDVVLKERGVATI